MGAAFNLGGDKVQGCKAQTLLFAAEERNRQLGATSCYVKSFSVIHLDLTCNVCKKDAAILGSGAYTYSTFSVSLLA